MMGARFGCAGLLLLAASFVGAQEGAAGHQHMTMPMGESVQAAPGSDLPALGVPTELLREARSRPALTLEALLTRALATDPGLAQTRAQSAGIEAQARQAGLYPNPTIGYEGDQIRGGSFGGGEQGGFLAQTIPLGGKLGLRRRALEAEAQANAAGTPVGEAALRNDLTQAFYAALAAQESAKIRRQLLAVAQDAVQTMHQLANVGQADAPDILAAEVEQEEATLADAAAQRLYLARFHVLAAVANQPGLAAAPLAGDLAAMPGVPSLERILEASPALLQARMQVGAAEARLAAARREVAPDLQLKAGGQYNFEQPGASSANRQTGMQGFASAALTLPLWNRNQGGIGAAEADVDAARQNVWRIQLRLQQQAQPLLETYLAATQHAEVYRVSILPRAKRAAQLDEQKYNQMAQGYSQVLVARRRLLELQLKYVDVLGAVWRTRTALENATLSPSMVQAGGRTMQAVE